MFYIWVSSEPHDAPHTYYWEERGIEKDQHSIHLLIIIEDPYLVEFVNVVMNIPLVVF